MSRLRPWRRERRALEQPGSLETALDAAPLMIRATGSDPTDCVWCNRAWIEFRGHPLADEAGTGWTRDIHPEDRDRVLEGLQRVGATGVPYETEYRIRHADGEYHTILEHGRPRRARDGSVGGFVVSADDVTQQREAERLIEQRAHRRAAVADLGRAALEGRSFHDLAGEATRVITEALDAEFAMVMEINAEDQLVPVAQRGFQQRVQARVMDEEDELTRLARETIAKRDPVVVANWGERAAAQEVLRTHKIRSSLSTPLRSPAGPVGVLAAHSRRTGAFNQDHINFLRSVANVLGAALVRQRVEHELRASETRLRLALEAGRMGTWQWEPESSAVHWSPELEQLFGESPGTFEETLEAFLGRVHPEDREYVQETVRGALDHGTKIEMEHRIVQPDGTVRWLEGRGSRVGDADPVRWIGVGIDIDARKAADQERERMLETEQQVRAALEETVARLDTLLEHSPYAFAFFDDEFRFVRLNDEFAAIDGIPIEEHLGHGIKVLLPEMWSQLQASFKEVVATRAAVTDLEVSGREPGTGWFERHFLVSCYPVQSASGEVLGLGAVFIDITERKRAELTATLLGSANELVARAADLDAVLQDAVDLVLPELADCAAVYVFPSPTSDRRFACSHVSDKAREAMVEMERRWPVDPESNATLRETIATGRPQLLAEFGPRVRRRFARDDEHLEMIERHGPRSTIAVPLLARGQVLGMLVLNYTDDSGRRYRHDDVPLAQELARRFATAIDAGLLAITAARSQARIDLLAQVGELVVVELEPGARMRRFVRIMSPQFADLCVLHLRDDNGDFKPEYLSASDAEAEVIGDERWPELPGDFTSPNRQACTSRVPVLLDETDVERLPVTHRARLAPGRDEGGAPPRISSLLCAPLLDEGDEPFGTLTFIQRSSGRHYAAEDRTVARDLARRAAAAFQHALSFERERATAETLQRSLLPQRAPDLPGVTTAARYLPGGESERIGGDWYDVFALPDGEVLLAIGDVVGHGLPAASSTGLLRSAVELAGLDSVSPQGILQQLNRWLLSLPDADMATAAVAIYEPATRVLRFASAGHPPLLRVRADGRTTFLTGALAPPLRVDSDVQYRERKIRLRHGDLLVLYTDGLVERRGESLDDGLARLREAAADAPRGLEALADHLLAQVLPEEGPSDDVAMIVVRTSAVEEPAESGARRRRRFRLLRRRLFRDKG